MTTVTLKVKPAVFRWIDNNFPKTKGKYDVRNTFLHEIVIAGLVRKNNNRQSEVSKKITQWQTIELIISGRYTEWYGNTLTEENQYRINCALYNLLIHEICTSVMHAHVVIGYPKNTMLKNYLLNCFYEENELSLACVSKIYQRKYLKQEKLIHEKFA